MHFEITSSSGAERRVTPPRLGRNSGHGRREKERREKEEKVERSFKDSHGTEFSFKRMRPTPRKAQRSRGGSRRNSTGVWSLVTVIPRDGTLIGNYAEQFEFHGSRHLRFDSLFDTPPSSSDLRSSLLLFAAAIFRSRYQSSLASTTLAARSKISQVSPKN